MESYVINQGDGQAEILLYGFIGAWKDTDSRRFISDFKKLESSNSKINVRINSGGGDVFEGITIYNTLKNSPSEIDVYIDGVAASMASVIALAGKKIFMSRYAQLMIHRVSGSANGDSEKLRETAALMDELQKSLLAIYSDKTGKDVSSIESTWMQRGKDSWFNATEAVQEKLVDEVFDGVIKRAPKKSNTAEEAWQFYNLQIQNSINQSHMEILSQFISFYNLNENATVQDILAAMQTQSNQNHDLKDENEKLKQQNSEFENQLREAQKQKVKDLIDSAIKSKFITEEQRATYTSLAESNFEATKVALNAITPYRSIASHLQITDDSQEEYKTFREYQEKAPQLLAEMKERDIEKYKSLYKKEFGKNPSLKN
ncbi:MAG TPA: head maturation protease, ClpP-related [Chitinophagales bacterium]|nr:head maturation protease, ClpP-related [Chitinophagales bacterium]